MSTSLLVSSPASPCGRTLTVMPVSALNFASTDFDIAQLSWVATTRVFGLSFESAPHPASAVVSSRALRTVGSSRDRIRVISFDFLRRC